MSCFLRGRIPEQAAEFGRGSIEQFFHAHSIGETAVFGKRRINLLEYHVYFMSRAGTSKAR